jgi:hypothetical protein
LNGNPWYFDNESVVSEDFDDQKPKMNFKKRNGKVGVMMPNSSDSKIEEIF